MTYEQAVMVCETLWQCICAGLTVNMHVNGVELSGVDNVGVSRDWFFVSGYDTEYHYRAIHLQFPIDAMKVSFLSAASIDHV